MFSSAFFGSCSRVDLELLQLRAERQLRRRIGEGAPHLGAPRSAPAGVAANLGRDILGEDVLRCQLEIGHLRLDGLTKKRCGRARPVLHGRAPPRHLMRLRRRRGGNCRRRARHCREDNVAAHGIVVKTTISCASGAGAAATGAASRGIVVKTTIQLG